MPAPVYGIFEGGGAKGLGHIAALKAAERNDLEFIGVAGASAGALIAALIAVGYKADELFDPNAPDANLLSRHRITPLSLIGEANWRDFEQAGHQVRRLFQGGIASRVFNGVFRGRKALRVGKTIRNDGGFFETETVREHLNDFLRRKLVQHHANAGRDTNVARRVRFKDIDPITVPECCSLKIIVTDISNRRMVVFDNTAEFANVEVAEAVAASIAIPAVFKPARIRSYAKGAGALYADGGLVSNLPVWVFAEEKLNYERTFLPNARVPILAFSLAEDAAATEPAEPGGIEYWTSLGRSAIFGGQSVAWQLTPDVRHVAMPIRLGVTDFNFAIRDALDAYEEAYAAAALYLVREMHHRPARIATLLGDFHTAALRLIGRLNPASPPGMSRVSLLQPFGHLSFRVTHSLNTMTDADDRLVFSRAVQGGPVAYERREPAFFDYAAMQKARANPNMTKYEFAMLPRHLSSAICLPVFRNEEAWAIARPSDRPVPPAVVAIDSDQDLTNIFRDQTAMQALAIRSVALSAAIEP